MAQHLKGASVSAEIIENIRREQSKYPGQVRLAVVRMGEKEEDLSYEKSIVKKAKEAGIIIQVHVLPEEITPKDASRLIEGLNADPQIHGVLVFRPLGNPLVEKQIVNTLAPHKDVDGITPLSMAGVYSDEEGLFPPCTAEACMRILSHYLVTLSGKKAVVLGRSQVIGKPVAMMLLKENATVTLCHSRTQNLMETVREADIVVTAIGKPRAVTGQFFRAGQVVIDVGINFDENGKLCGDVDFEEADKVVAAITPVPGGVGVVTTALLLEHTMKAAKR
jgi:methylenetetrahydrofolate dehydrogenase (NADP+)/methenyltetrahydrofolate cyclohydrolase